MRKGYALLITIYVILAFAILAITVAAFVAGESIANALTLNAQKAVHLGEAGVDYMLAKQLISDSNWLDNKGDYYNNVSLGAGIFDVIVTDSTSNSCTIESTGYINKGSAFLEIKRKIRVKIEKITADSALLYAIATIDRINLNVSSGTISGSDLISGSTIVLGGITGSFEAISNESVSIPNINWDAYQGIADYVVAGDYEFNNAAYNGVYYITGNATIKDNVTINGSVITRGNVNMNNSQNLIITPTPGYPALVSDQGVSGDILATHLGDSVINGLIYSSGNLTLNNLENVTVNGGIVCGGRLSMVNGDNFILNYDPIIQDVPFLQDNPLITITSWRSL